MSLDGKLIDEATGGINAPSEGQQGHFVVVNQAVAPEPPNLDYKPQSEIVTALTTPVADALGVLMVSGDAAARFVWRPGGTSTANIISSLTACVAAALAVAGSQLVDIVLDDSAGALTLPASQVDLQGRVRFRADHDVELIAGDGASFLNAPGTVTDNDAEITVSVSGGGGAEVFQTSGTFPAGRIPRFERVRYNLVSGARKLYDFSAVSVVSFAGGDIDAIVCGALVVQTRGICDFGADPFTASGDVTINYHDRIASPAGVAGVAGTFFEYYFDAPVSDDAFINDGEAIGVWNFRNSGRDESDTAGHLTFAATPSFADGFRSRDRALSPVTAYGESADAVYAIAGALTIHLRVYIDGSTQSGTLVSFSSATTGSAADNFLYRLYYASATGRLQLTQQSGVNLTSFSSLPANDSVQPGWHIVTLRRSADGTRARINVDAITVADHDGMTPATGGANGQLAIGGLREFGPSFAGVLIDAVSIYDSEHDDARVEAFTLKALGWTGTEGFQPFSTTILPVGNLAPAPPGSPVVGAGTGGELVPSSTYLFAAWRLAPSTPESLALPVRPPLRAKFVSISVGILRSGSGSNYGLEFVGSSDESTFGSVVSVETGGVSSVTLSEKLLVLRMPIVDLGLERGRLNALHVGRDITVTGNYDGDILIHSVTLHWS